MEESSISVCVKGKYELLGKINVGAATGRPPEIELSDNGKIVESAILNISAVYEAITVDRYIIMPNHVHMIILIETGRACGMTINIGYQRKFILVGVLFLCSIAEMQDEFFNALVTIQERTVVSALSEYKDMNLNEDLLYDVSFELIAGILTLIDGYGNLKVKVDLIDKETGISIKKGIELHDKCADYLHYTK